MNDPLSHPARSEQAAALRSLRDAVPAPQERAARRARLRAVNLQCGVDPRYLEMRDRQRMWFVRSTLDREVQAGPLGFTRFVMDYALGADEAEAIAAVTRYMAEVAPEVRILRADVKPPCVSHVEELTFPEQVRRLDMPARPRRAKVAP